MLSTGGQRSLPVYIHILYIHLCIHTYLSRQNGLALGRGDAPDDVRVGGGGGLEDQVFHAPCSPVCVRVCDHFGLVRIYVCVHVRRSRSACPSTAFSHTMHIHTPSIIYSYTHTHRQHNIPSKISKLGVPASSRRMASLYKSRSACARGPRTAGPFRLLRILKWMPVGVGSIYVGKYVLCMYGCYWWGEVCLASAESGMPDTTCT